LRARIAYYPPTQKATAFEAVDECVEGTLRSSYERSGVCFGGFRLPARSRFGEGRPYEACGGATGFSPWGLHMSREMGVPWLGLPGM